MTATIELEAVDFAYGARGVLHGLSAALGGKACGLLGANGAGKTTLLRILLGHLTPSAGRVRVLGVDPSSRPREVRRRVGFMPEEDAHLARLSALEAVTLLGELSGMPRPEAHRRAHEALHFVGLGETRYRPLPSLSRGVRQRARLAQALVHDPELLLLDEPLSNLDPGGREEMASLLAEVARERGATVLLSTHVLRDVEKLCEEVLILREGHTVASGAIAALGHAEAGLARVGVEGDAERFREALRAAGLEARRGERGDFLVRLPLDPQGEGERATRPVFAAARRSGCLVRRLRPLRRTLEDVFETFAAPGSRGGGAEDGDAAS